MFRYFETFDEKKSTVSIHKTENLHTTEVKIEPTENLQEKPTEHKTKSEFMEEEEEAEYEVIYLMSIFIDYDS